MAIHVYLVLSKVFVQRNIVLLFICFHPPLESVVEASGFRSYTNMMIIEKLNAFHVVLEAAISKLSHIDLVGKSQLLNMSRKYS